jgi:thioredoxin 1
MLKPLLILALVIGGYLYTHRSSAPQVGSAEAVTITGPDGRAMKLSDLDPEAQAKVKQAIAELNSRGAARQAAAATVQSVPEIYHSSKPVLVDFWAPWCGPCRALAPTIEALASQRTDVVVRKVNTDERPGVTQTFNIRGIPCLILFKNGKEVDRLVGGVPRSEIEAMIARNK